MQLLALFLLGFCFTYVTNMMDLLSQLFEANIALKITKINAHISEWTPSDKFDDSYRIGFTCPDEYDEEYYDDEDYDE